MTESTTIRHTQEAHVPPVKYVYRCMTWSSYIDRMTFDSEVYKLSNWVEVADICRVRGYDYTPTL